MKQNLIFLSCALVALAQALHASKELSIDEFMQSLESGSEKWVYVDDVVSCLDGNYFRIMDGDQEACCVAPHALVTAQLHKLADNDLVAMHESVKKLEQGDYDVILELLGDSDSAEAVTRKKLKSKTFCSLKVRENITTNNLRVCGTATINNLIITGSSATISGTPCDTPSTIVARDGSGSFDATTVTLNGNSLVNYSSVGGCDSGAGYVWAPTNQNSIIGLNAGNDNTLTGSSNTVFGFDALASATTAFDNTVVGVNAGKALVGGRSFTYTNTSGIAVTAIGGAENVAFGVNALASTQQGFGNVAFGSGALMNATDFVSGPPARRVVPVQFNVAVGFEALANTTAGNGVPGTNPFVNTAVGSFALTSNVEGTLNTAIGNKAMAASINGTGNIAIGDSALSNTETPSNDIAIGLDALLNDNGSGNNIAIGGGAIQNGVPGFGFDVAVGPNSLANDNGGWNVGIGLNTLTNLTSGTNNVAIGVTAGSGAGFAYTGNESNNILISNVGVVGDQNTIRIGTQGVQTSCYIQGISNVTPPIGSTTVMVNGNGQLSAMVSSKRYKENIQDMSTSTKDIYKLRPVLFNYKADAAQQRQYGLIAEEVEQVYPNIVVKNKDGEVETVQYQYLPVMMLNEMQKDHARINQLEDTIATLKQQIADLQK